MSDPVSKTRRMHKQRAWPDCLYCLSFEWIPSDDSDKQKDLDDLFWDWAVDSGIELGSVGPKELDSPIRVCSLLINKKKIDTVDVLSWFGKYDFDFFLQIRGFKDWHYIDWSTL